MPEQLTTLDGQQSGIWEIETRDSRLLIDLDASTLRRIPGAQANTLPLEHTEQLLTVEHCMVGKKGLFILTRRGWELDYVSSAVQSITRRRDSRLTT